MAGDWIRLHRKLLDSAVFSDEWLLRLWVWCLLRAGYCDRQVGGFTVPAGSFLTGRFSAADELNVSPSRWYRGIHQLASLGMITLSATQERTIVTVCHWTSYQSDTVVHGQQVNSMRTASEQRADNERTTSGQQTDTRKEGKEEEERKEGKECKEEENKSARSPTGNGKLRKPRIVVAYSPDFERFWQAYPPARRQNKPEAFALWPQHVEAVRIRGSIDDAAAVDWLVGRARDYAASDQGKGQYCRGPVPWLNQSGYDDPPESWSDKHGPPRPGPGQRWTAEDEQRANANIGGDSGIAVASGRFVP